MSVSVISHVSQLPVTSRFVHLAVQSTLSYLKMPNADVSVQLCADAKVKKLNAAYRGKDRTTDVLSFPTDLPMSGDIPDLGDLVLSIPQIIRQAKQHRISPKEELARMLIHGTLHLAGYRHDTPEDKTNMFFVQERLLLRVCA